MMKIVSNHSVQTDTIIIYWIFQEMAHTGDQIPAIETLHEYHVAAVTTLLKKLKDLN